MVFEKKEKDIISTIEEFERTLHLRHSITPKKSLNEVSNIFERLGFTTSLNSEIKTIEQDSSIQIISPFPQTQKIQPITELNQFGQTSPGAIKQVDINPHLRRFKFISSLIMSLLLLVIIVNFILIFLL